MTLSPCKPRSPSWRRSFDANLLSLPSRDRQPSPLLTQLDTRTDIIVKLKQMNAHSMAQQAPCRFSSRPQTRWSSLRWAQWTVEARLHPVSLLFHSGQVVADRLCVRRGGGGWTRILQECHDRPLGRYLCPRKTAAPVRRPAYRRQTHDVDAYVRSCEVCQRAKADHVGPRGLLHPLPLPSRLGGVIGVDWLMGLMTSDHQ